MTIVSYSSRWEAKGGDVCTSTSAWDMRMCQLHGEGLIRQDKDGKFVPALAERWAVLVGLSVGIISAVKMGGWFDNFGKIFALIGQAAPTFWLGLMLMLAFTVHLRWFPTSGIGGLKYIILPSLTLGAYFMASIVRITRSALLREDDSYDLAKRG